MGVEGGGGVGGGGAPFWNFEGAGGWVRKILLKEIEKVFANIFC